MPSSDDARVRPAFRSDIEPLVEMLGREFVPIVPDAEGFDPARAVAVLDGLPRVYLALLGGRIVGCLALRHEEWWWTGRPFVTDMVFFLAREARATTLARRLLEAGERYAESLGWPLLIGVLSGEDLHRKDVWFRRRGYRALGGLYLKDAAPRRSGRR